MRTEPVRCQKPALGAPHCGCVVQCIPISLRDGPTHKEHLQTMPKTVPDYLVTSPDAPLLPPIRLDMRAPKVLTRYTQQNAG